MLVAERVIAVVPAFRPDGSVLDRLTALARQVESVIVVDDGSGEEFSDLFERIETSGFDLVRNAANLGIGEALNVGTARALSLGADFVLTVDQDSVLAEDYVRLCLAAFRQPSQPPEVGVACAESINDSHARPEAYTPGGFGIVREAIQSGFLISRRCLETCGLFDARLFIDDVDTEFCLRISTRGFVTVVVEGARMSHSLGELVPFRPFGITTQGKDGHPITYQYHPPFRRYFIVRNNVDLYFRYLRRRPRWVASSIKREFEPTLKSIVAGPHRARHLLATVVGVAHGVIRRRGPLGLALRKALSPSS